MGGRIGGRLKGQDGRGVGWGRGRVGLGGGQGRCEQRIEVFVKIQKKIGGGSCRGEGREGVGLGVRVDMCREVKLL